MANHKSALKRIRQTKKRTIRNRHYRSTLRTLTKKLLATPDQPSAIERLRDVTSLLDKLAKKHIIHRNKAANQKSRIALFYNKLPEKAAE